MHNSRRSGLAAWATASMFVALLAYPLCFGPACWLADRNVISFEVVTATYAPIIWAMRANEPVATTFLWYSEIGCSGNGFVPLILLILVGVNPES